MPDRIPFVDTDACISCGACVDVCPEVFVLNESLGYALVINPYGSDEDKVQEAMDICPVNCIHWEE